MRRLIVENKTCLLCKKEFGRESCKKISDFKEKKFCSKKCYWEYNSGENNHNYKNGFRTRPDGYIRDSQDNYLHRLVVEKHIGRKLKSSEHIHHLDGDRSNNNISNLTILTNSEHRKLHVPTQKRNNKGQFA